VGCRPDPRLGSLDRLAGEVGDLLALSHSAGSIEVPLASAGVYLAAGCTYKHPQRRTGSVLTSGAWRSYPAALSRVT
jgi:hypothetical protein